MPDEPSVGLIGLGLLGDALASRLLAAEFSVVGFDIDRAKSRRLAKAGGITASSIGALAKGCDPIVLAVFDTDQVEQVVERDLLPALGENSGKVVLCASTCDPDRIQRLGRRLQSLGLRFLEVPVSGTSEQVKRGQGVGLIGGPRETMARASPVLKAMFRRRIHVGTFGDGSRAKLAVNLILGLNRAALAEGLVFADRLGLDAAAFLEVARRSAAYSQVMDTKGPKMAARDFAPEGRVRQTLKDAHLMLAQARATGQELPLLAVHAEILEACVQAGEGERDNSVVVEEIRRRNREGTGRA